MAFLRRIGLFLLTNTAIIVLFTVLTKLLGLEAHYLTPNGLNLKTLALFSFLFGMTGSFISLLLSKWMAKTLFKIKLIENPANSKEKIIYDSVQKITQQAGIKTPEIGIYESATPNAFATGASQNSSLVAVSTGLLDLMENDEIEGVIGHEMSHILNGDMVTLTLLQGVLNTFVIFFSRVVASIFAKNNDNFGHIIQLFLTIILEIVFGFFAGIIVAWFSRYREFRADAGSAKYFGTEKMIKALKKLQNIHDEGVLQKNKSFATMGIFGSVKSLRATHPPLEKRILALQGLQQ